MSQGERITGSAAILYAMNLSVRIIGLCSTVLLARILTPEDFGLVALAVSYLAIIEGLTAINLNSALIRIQDESADLYDTAWTLGLLRAIGIALIIVISASFFPSLMREPRLEAVIYILALQPIFQGLMNPRFTAYEKNLNFKPLFVVSVSSRLIATIFTVVVAILYQSYWALIIGALISSFMNMILSYVMQPYMPRWQLGRIRDIFGFTAWLSGVSVLSALNVRLDNFIIGGFLDIKYVGYYRMGEDLISLPTGELVGPLTRSLFPAFSAMADEPEKLKTNTLEASSVIAAITLPITFGFAFLAEDVVRLLISEKWLFIVPMIQILTPIIGLQTLSATAISVCMATGHTRDIFLSEIIFFLVRLGAIFIGIINWGFSGLIWGRVVSGLVYVLISNWRIKQAINISLFAPFTHAWRSILSAVLMVAALWGFQNTSLFNVAEFSVFLRLSGAIIIGAFTYVFLHWILWRLSGRPGGAEQRFIGVIHKITHKSA